MHRLFWKIFGWFWGAMILIGLALYFVVLTTRPDPLPAAWRVTAEAALHTTGRAAAEWERGGAPALAEYLDREGRNARTRYWFFDQNDRELSGQPLPEQDGSDGPPPGASPGDPPPGAPPDERPRDVGPGGPPPEPLTPLFGTHPPPSVRLVRLRRQAPHSKHALFEMAGPLTVAALPVRASSGRRYVLAALMHSPHFGRHGATQAPRRGRRLGPRLRRHGRTPEKLGRRATPIARRHFARIALAALAPFDGAGPGAAPRRGGHHRRRNERGAGAHRPRDHAPQRADRPTAGTDAPGKRRKREQRRQR